MIPRPTIKTHGRAVVEAIDAADAEGDPLYTTTEVAATFRTAGRTVVRWFDAGMLPFSLIVTGAVARGGKALLVRDSDLRRLLNR